MKFLISVGILVMLHCSLRAQELICKVQINSEKVQGTNKQIFATLQETITELVNNQKWSEAQFMPTERIECTFMLTFREMTDNRFKGDIQIQARRPVYNASYASTLINFKDPNLDFTYQEFEPLRYSDTQIENNLVAILSFYVNIILGLDFDSFSPMGGTPFFQRAEQIVNMAQTLTEGGWKAFEDTKNRHAIATAFMDNRTSSFRQLWYDYHRKGLDEMTISPDKGRAKITNCIQQLDELSKAAPTSVLLPMFSDTKLDEILNIYTKAQKAEKENVYNILSAIYPSSDTRLQEIKKESYP